MTGRLFAIGLMLVALTADACGQPSGRDNERLATLNDQDMEKEGMRIATLGAGCFWCVEAVFQELKGVYKVESGYSGGTAAEANYRQVCSGSTGHAEVVQVHYDPEELDFATVLEVFWATHDPTTLNRQGNDRGPQYRSVIFYHDEEQRRLAEWSKKTVAPQAWDDPIVTEIAPFDAFYPAEPYHQDYYRQNTNAPYCRAVITPKMAKFRARFADKLR